MQVQQQHDPVSRHMVYAPIQPRNQISDQHLDPPSHPIDVSRHLENLKTRLNFACFKLHNGWENSTLIDVELMWKKRQKKLYNEIPTPRFTQQDILDKRGQFSSAKVKKAKLTRTYSTPLTSTRDPYRKRKHRPQQSPPPAAPSAEQYKFQHYDDHHTSPSIHYHHPHSTQHTTPATAIPTTASAAAAASTAPLPPAGTDDMALDDSCTAASLSSPSPHANATSPVVSHENVSRQAAAAAAAAPPPPVKSSLDFLSYAIEMTEGNTAAAASSQRSLDEPPSRMRMGDGMSSSQPQPDISRVEPQLYDDGDEDEDEMVGGSQERSTLRTGGDGAWERKRARSFQNDDRRFSGAETESDDQLSPPSSPVTAAAHAIMMFVNDHYSIDSSPKPAAPSMYN